MAGLDLRRTVGALARESVRYVIIGGVAVAAHGYVRTTADIDIVPDPSPDNLLALGNALVAISAVLPLAGNRPFSHERDGAPLAQGHNLTLGSALGGVDIVQRAAGVPSFRVLAERAVPIEVFGSTVLICSLADLREMRRTAGRTVDQLGLANLPED